MKFITRYKRQPKSMLTTTLLSIVMVFPIFIILLSLALTRDMPADISGSTLFDQSAHSQVLILDAREERFSSITFNRSKSDNSSLETTIPTEKITSTTIADPATPTPSAKPTVPAKLATQQPAFEAGFTSQTMVFKPISDTVYITANTLNLRESFTLDAKIISALSNGTKLTRIGIGDGWSKVKTASGQIGYVVSKYLTNHAPVVQNSTKTTATVSNVTNRVSGNKIVDLAYKALGTPYVFGGESLSGMDCTGLVYWAYRQIGISVPRCTSGYPNAGTGVSLANAKPGDVICFDTHPGDGRSTIAHVGIYIGGDQIIHASTSRHKIIIASVSGLCRYGYKIVTIRRFQS